MRRHLITATTLAIASTALLAGCGGNDLEGTYVDAREGQSVLMLGADGTCDLGVMHEDGTHTAELDDDCTWTRSDDELTFVNLRSATVYATVNDDGSITMPHQHTYDSALYVKQD